MKFPIFQKTQELVFSYLETDSHWSMSYPHYHDGYEIYLQTEGVREIFFQNKSYLLKPGTLCIITPHILHATKNINNHPKYSRYLINFSSRIFCSFLSDTEQENFFNEVSPCIIQLNENQVNMVLNHFHAIDEYWSMHLNKTIRGKKLAHIEVYRLMDHLVRIIHSASDISSLKDVSVISDSEIYSVLYYIEHHYFEDIVINDMIKLAKMSKSTFYREFKQITGDSFHHYLNQYRVVMAHKLLLNTKLPLHHIAKKTGFSSTGHLTRIFKELHGISPLTYRKINRS